MAIVFSTARNICKVHQRAKHVALRLVDVMPLLFEEFVGRAIHVVRGKIKPCILSPGTPQVNHFDFESSDLFYSAGAFCYQPCEQGPLSGVRHPLQEPHAG